MKNLFDKSMLRNKQVKNRFVRTGLWEDACDVDGHINQNVINIYEELAQGGVGILTTGYARVTKEEAPNPGMMAMYDDMFIDEYKKLTDVVSKYDVVFLMQLAYGGSMTGYNLGERKIFGPSAIMNESTKVVPVEMTKEDIIYLTNQYANAALRAQKAGFDGITIHAAHGYLLSHFLCPYYNQRTDEYGGSIDNRARIIYEIYAAIRNICNDDFIITIKINCEDFMESDGLTKEDSMHVCQELSKKGIDAIELSGGNSSSRYVLKNNLMTSRTGVKISIDNESYFKQYAIDLANTINTPVILTGGNRSYEVMDNILNNSNVSYFAFGRPLTAEPDLINKLKEDHSYITKCASCNQCYKTEFRRCILNENK